MDIPYDNLYLNHNHMKIKCFLDADRTRSKVNKRPTSRYLIFVGVNLVSWKSKNQIVIPPSSAKLEYNSIAQSVCEIMWVP